MFVALGSTPRCGPVLAAVVARRTPLVVSLTQANKFRPSILHSVPGHLVRTYRRMKRFSAFFSSST